MFKVATIFLWLMIYSFIGWFYESTLCSITGKKLVNRGFLNGPVCPVYGFGALLIIFFLQREENSGILTLFLASAVLTCTLEYLTSWILEKLFHTRWWDYSRYRFQINGRICLLGAIVFGLLSVLLIKVVHPLVREKVAMLPEGWLYLISGTLAVIFIADIIVTVKAVLAMNHKLEQLQAVINQEKQKYTARLEELKAEIQERNADIREGLHERSVELKISFQEKGGQAIRRFEKSEFYSEHIKALLERKNFVERRLLKAFPKMKSVRHEDALNSLKEKLKKYKK